MDWFPSFLESPCRIVAAGIHMHECAIESDSTVENADFSQRQQLASGCRRSSSRDLEVRGVEAHVLAP